MYRLRINTAEPYEVITGPGVCGELAAHVRGRAFFAADGNTAQYACGMYGAKTPFTMRAGEEHKNHETLISLYSFLATNGVGRGDTLVAVGGGVVCDLAGYAAATYMRGIRFIACPTTLIAMADAALGGKCAVNTDGGKNLVGAVHQPALVLEDTDTLLSLPKRERISGMAEIIKCAAIADAKLADMLPKAKDEELIHRACLVKKKYVEADPYDENERHALNFGHTVGHAAERASGFSLSHGEAVAMGMAAEAELGERLGITAAGTAERIKELLMWAKLPVKLPDGINRDGLKKNLMLDKKLSGGTVLTPLITDFGGCALFDIPPEEFLGVI